MTFNQLVWLTASLLVLAIGPAAAQDKPAGNKAAKILFIGKQPDHPYGSHMYLHTSGVLAKCVALTPGIESIVSDGWPQDAKQLEGVKAIVIYTSPAAEILLDGGHRDDVDRVLKSGVGLVTIHWASTVKKENVERLGPAWLSYLGGTWVSNVGLSFGKSPLKQLDSEHPICRGWREYEIEDEFYLNPTIEKARPLLQVREKGGKDVIVGWTYERGGGGRSFATTLGHPYKNFQDERFRRMIVNGILWAAHIDVPESGAPVNIGEALLALPPKP